MTRARLLTAALCLLAIAGTTTAIRVLAPEPYVPLVTEKLARLEEMGEEVTVLFAGSSLVYRHLSPAAFDRTLTRKGYPTRSFNLGLPGARNAETLYLLRRLRELHLPNLRWVLIETGGWLEPIEATNVRTPRVVYWHQWDETRHAMAGTMLSPAGSFEVYDQARLHLFAFLLNVSGVSRLRLGFTETLPSPTQEIAGPIALGVDRAGYVGLPPVDERRRFDTDSVTARIEQRLAQRRNLRVPAQPNPNALGPTREAMFVALNEAIEDLGATPVQVVSPIIAYRGELAAAQAAGITPIVFDFNDPETYPQFYELSARADQVHLNRFAATDYSRLVANELSRYLDQEERQSDRREERQEERRAARQAERESASEIPDQ